MASASPMLHEDHVTAAQVEEALRVLHRGDASVADADRFLCNVRSSPLAWPTCAALIRSQTTSPAALMFASRTVYTRTRSDWLGFVDAPARGSVFGVALEGLARPSGPVIGENSSSPVYYFGRACGFCLMMAQTPVERESMWSAMLHRTGQDVLLKCKAFDAVLKEMDEVSRVDVQKHVMMSSFCRQKVMDVVPGAIFTLKTGCGDVAVDDVQDIQGLRAAVLCLLAWQRYAPSVDIVAVLVRAIRVARLADDVADALNEIIGYSGTNTEMLVSTCAELVSSYRAVLGSDSEGVVHHAIAEVACALSDGNADEVMEQEDVLYKRVAVKATDLLWLCLQSRDERAFLASVEGWSNWICAANLVAQGRDSIGEHRIGAVVAVVVQRMKSLQFVLEVVESGTNHSTDRANEKACIMDFLLEATSSLGVVGYVQAISPLLDDHWNTSPQGLCASLLAFAVAGEVAEVACSRKSDGTDMLLNVLQRIMTFLESFESGQIQDRNGCVPLQQAALNSLRALSSVLSAYGSDGVLLRAVRCAGRGIMDPNLSVKAAQFLRELAGTKPERLTTFLPELIKCETSMLSQMTDKSAEDCIRGLSKIAACLATYEERRRALEVILESSCQQLLWTCANKGNGNGPRKLTRFLCLIGGGIEDINDNEVATALFERLRPTVFEVALEHCADDTISKAVCFLFEVSVLPTLMDDGHSSNAAEEAATDDRRKRILQDGESHREGGRVLLAMSCMSLAAQCFLRSGKDGETCWLQAIGDITPHVLECLEGGFSEDVRGRALACLSVSLQHSLDGLHSFTHGNYESQVEMTVAYFRFVTMLLSPNPNPSPVSEHAAKCARVGLDGLESNEVSIVREALCWWKAVCSPKVAASTTALVLSGGGGPVVVTRGLMFAARHARCAGAVADALYLLSKWMAAASGESDPDNAMRACLSGAFANSAAPGARLDAQMREILYRRCFNSVGSQRELRRALKEFGRICATTM